MQAINLAIAKVTHFVNKKGNFSGFFFSQDWIWFDASSLQLIHCVREGRGTKVDSSANGDSKGGLPICNPIICPPLPSLSDLRKHLRTNNRWGDLGLELKRTGLRPCVLHNYIYWLLFSTNWKFTIAADDLDQTLGLWISSNVGCPVGYDRYDRRNWYIWELPGDRKVHRSTKGFRDTWRNCQGKIVSSHLSKTWSVLSCILTTGQFLCRSGTGLQ